MDGSPLFPPLLTFLAVAAYGAVHSFLAGTRPRRAARRLFGEAGWRGYRLAYNVFSVISLIPVLAIPARDPGRLLYALPAPWAGLALAGQALAAVAAAITLWQTDAWRFAGLRQLLGEETSAPPRLVLHGLYRWVRHPLYTCALVFLWLTPLMTTSLLALYLGLSAYLVVGSVFEERRLVAEYGEAYRVYQGQVPRLVPFGRPRPD